MQTSAYTFYLDNVNSEVDYSMDPFELSPIETAQRLYESYRNTVQDSFPILPSTSFTEQFYQYYASVRRGATKDVPHAWLATLNLVFAIGSKYFCLVGDQKTSSRDHLVFQSRAQILRLNGQSLVLDPDLMRIQVTALLAFYFLSVGRVNR